MRWFGEAADEVLEHATDARVVVQCDSQNGALAQPVERRSGGDGAQVVQTFFVVCAAEPVNGIAAVLAFAFEVVNLHARDLITCGIAQQEDREVSCFDCHAICCCADKHNGVADRVHRAMKLANRRIDSNARTHVEGVCRPVRRLTRARSRLSCLELAP